MLPLPSNALERFSAKDFGLITGYFPWIKSGGDLRVDSRNDSLLNLRFCDMVSVERFRVKWRKRLTAVLQEFDECMKFFWVRVFEGIARWHDLGALAGHGATPNDSLEIFIHCCPNEEREQVYQAFDALHSNAVEDAQDRKTSFSLWTRVTFGVQATSYSQSCTQVTSWGASSPCHSKCRW